jgi:hypothetical protein
LGPFPKRTSKVSPGMSSVIPVRRSVSI